MRHSVSVLPNGLQVVHVSMPAMRSVAVGLFVRFGSRYELERHSGAAHLIEHMLFKGTERYANAGVISKTIDGVGGILNASTDKEVTAYWTKVAHRDLPLAVNLVAEMLLHSRFRSADLARERDVVLDELSMLVDDSEEWAHVVGDEMLWPDHPLGREVAGTREGIRRVARHELLEYMGQYYGPNNAVLSCAGATDHGTIVDIAERQFSEWEPVVGGEAEPAPDPGTGSQTRLISRPTEQLHLVLVFPGVHREHPHRWPLDLLCTILGGGTSSRLFLRIRETLGLAYDIQAYSSYFSDTGSVTISAGTDPEKADRLLEAVWGELARLRARRVTDTELQRTKQYYRGRLFLGLEDTFSVANWFGGQQLLNGHVNGPEEIAAVIDRVTAGEIREAARAYLRDENVRLVAVGPSNDLPYQSGITPRIA